MSLEEKLELRLLRRIRKASGEELHSHTGETLFVEIMEIRKEAVDGGIWDRIERSNEWRVLLFWDQMLREGRLTSQPPHESTEGVGGINT